MHLSCSVVAFAPGLWMMEKACKPGMPGKMVAGPNPMGNVVGSAKAEEVTNSQCHVQSCCFES